MLILSGVLLERAFRRDATSFMYAAALGLIVALTDLNVSYLSASTEIALFLEGVDPARGRVRGEHAPPTRRPAG